LKLDMAEPAGWAGLAVATDEVASTAATIREMDDLRMDDLSSGDEWAAL
jgi:hypothetical protein